MKFKDEAVEHCLAAILCAGSLLTVYYIQEKKKKNQTEKKKKPIKVSNIRSDLSDYFTSGWHLDNEHTYHVNIL